MIKNFKRIDFISLSISNIPFDFSSIYDNKTNKYKTKIINNSSQVEEIQGDFAIGHFLLTDPVINSYNIAHQEKYEIKLFKDTNVLLLDFDETLGSFHICYSYFSYLLEHYGSGVIDRQKILSIKSHILKYYHIRPGLDIFLKKILDLKKKNKIGAVVIMSRNSDKNNYPGYFSETVKLLMEITNTKSVIDASFTDVSLKDLDAFEQYGFIKKQINKMFIIDDKCEHVKPLSKCIGISPYITYVTWEVYIQALKNYKVPKEIINKIEKILITNEPNDFNLENPNSYINQYKHISNFDTLQIDLATKSGFKILNSDDNELIRVYDIIDKIYNV